jgi:hypothetical protein
MAQTKDESPVLLFLLPDACPLSVPNPAFRRDILFPQLRAMIHYSYVGLTNRPESPVSYEDAGFLRF